MSDAALETPKTTLLNGPADGAKPDAPAVVQVARQFGISPFKQLRESLALRFGKSQLSSKEYYAYGLYDPAMSSEEKREFVGVTANKSFNTSLTPPILAPTHAFVGNKLLYTLLLDRLGVGTSVTQAVVSGFRDAGDVPMLRNAEDIAAFLKNDAVFPLFGKPLQGSQSTGTVRLEKVDGSRVVLSNGHEQDVDAFAAEIMQKYPMGYLIQTALDPHPDMAAISGDTLGSVRVVTVNDGTSVKPVYSVWKLPAPGAMSDNFWQAGSLLSLLDIDTGEIRNLRRGSGLNAENLTDHPTSHVPVVGKRIPMWQDILDISVKAHSVFPEFGICGFDIAVTANGPKILECNDGPSHALFQHAAGRGVLNAEFTPIWGRVIEHQKSRLARYKSAQKSKKGKA